MTHGVGRSADALWLGTREGTAVTHTEPRLNNMQSHLRDGVPPQTRNNTEGQMPTLSFYHLKSTLAPWNLHRILAEAMN